MPIPQHLTPDLPIAEQRLIDAHALRNYLDTFICQNASSRDVEHRWLANYAVDLLTQACNVKAGNHDTIKPLVEKFRLAEIAKAREELAKQAQALDIEAGKIINGQLQERKIIDSQVAEPLR